MGLVLTWWIRVGVRSDDALDVGRASESLNEQLPTILKFRLVEGTIWPCLEKLWCVLTQGVDKWENI